MGFKSKYSGRQLEEKLDSIKNINVIDALDSEDSAAALSANQGRVLKEYVDSTIAQAIITTLNTEV